MKGLLYSCLLIMHLPSRSRKLNWHLETISNLPRFVCDLMPCLLQQDSWDTIWRNMAGSKWAARFQAKLSQVDRKEYGSSRTKTGHRWMGRFGGKFGLVGWCTMHTQEKLYLKAFCYSNILVLFPGSKMGGLGTRLNDSTLQPCQKKI